MQCQDLDFAAGYTAAEGWASETRAQFEGFLAHDEGGCLVAEEEGRRIAICVATGYGTIGFVGELIVIPEARGRGVGRALLDRAVEHLQGRGAQSISLDGVLAAVSLYERAGFRKVCRSLRFAGKVRGRERPLVRPMQVGDLDAVRALDRVAFGADRGFFLERRLALYPGWCRVLEQSGGIAGFVMGRPAGSRVSAGPWVVRQDVERPADLLEGLAAEGEEVELGLGILETNEGAVATVRALGFAVIEDTTWRMVLGAAVTPGCSAEAMAIGSPAKG